MAITKVTTDVITDGAVTAPKLATDSVTADKLAANSVTAAKIAAGTLTDQVANNSITAAKIPNATALTLDGGVTIDNITIDGTEIDLSSGSLTIDVASTLIVDADGGQISFRDGGTEIGVLENASSDFQIESKVQDKDIKLVGNDNGSAVTALTLDMSEAGKATFNNGIVSNAGVVVDNITIDGTEIDLSSGDLTLDVAGDIILDADGGDVKFYDGGTNIGNFVNSSSDFAIEAMVQDKDIIFKGDDGGSGITALTLDMSDAGKATFNAGADFSNTLKVTRTGTDDAGILLATANANRYLASDENGVVSIGTGTTLTGGTQYLTIDSGNVGIGTTTVRGTNHIKNAGNNWEDGLLLEGDSGNKGWNFHTETSGELLIGYNAATNAALTDQAATTVLNLQTDGQVGINVDPTAYLDVRAPSGVSGPNVAYFKSDQHGLGVYINIGSTYSEIRSNNNSYALVLNASSGGNVGIGTTAPAETLHIKRADGSAIVVESSNDQNNTGDRVAVEFRSDAGMGLSKVVGGKHSNYQSAGARDGYLSLQNFISNSWVERMRIQPDGVTKLVGGETGGRNDLLFNNGAMSLADNAAYTLSGVANTGVLIAIGQQRSVSGITYDHCLIFAEHSTALTMVANPSGRFGTSSGTDTLTNIYVSGGDVILENKVGTTNGYTFACFVFQGN